MLTFDTNGEFKDNYKFIIGSLVPRPIAWVSTRNTDGSANLAPFSFFTAVSARPMIVGFSPLIRSTTGEKKDTLVNIEREKQFVINFVTEENAELVNKSAMEVEYGVDEFEEVGLTKLDSLIVNAPRVKESPIHFECKLRDILSYGEERGQGSFVTGEVVKIHVAPKIYEEGRINTDLYRPMGRGAGADWVRTRDRVELKR